MNNSFDRSINRNDIKLYIFCKEKRKIFDLDVLRNILFKIYHLFVKKFSLRFGFLLFEKI